MTFALFYNFQDFSDIVAQIQNADGLVLSVADKQAARRVWNGGLRDWQQAPVATGQYAEGAVVESPVTVDGELTGQTILEDNRARVIAINSTVTKADFVALLKRIAAQNPSAWFMETIADDVNRRAVEPWP